MACNEADDEADDNCYDWQFKGQAQSSELILWDILISVDHIILLSFKEGFVVHFLIISFLDWLFLVCSVVVLIFFCLFLCLSVHLYLL